MKKGCADFYICNQLYTAHEGDILISNTKYPHSMQQYKDESADYFSILINTKLLQQDMKSEVIHDELIDKIRRIEDASLIFPPFIKADSELAKSLCPFLDNIIEHRKECYSEYQLLVIFLKTPAQQIKIFVNSNTIFPKSNLQYTQFTISMSKNFLFNRLHQCVICLKATS